MARSAVLALLALLLGSATAAAAPSAFPLHYSWRLAGTVTAVSLSHAAPTDYGPFLSLGDSVEGFVGVVLPAGSDLDGILGLSLFDATSGADVMRASVTPRPGFDGSRAAAAPSPFVFEGVLDGFVSFDGVTGALLELEGTADLPYRNSPFAQFRWSADSGVIQQLANAAGQTEPAHYFAYSWEAEFLGVRQVPEPGGGLLVATALALLGAFLARARRL